MLYFRTTYQNNYRGGIGRDAEPGPAAISSLSIPVCHLDHDVCIGRSTVLHAAKAQPLQRNVQGSPSKRHVPATTHRYLSDSWGPCCQIQFSENPEVGIFMGNLSIL